MKFPLTLREFSPRFGLTADFLFGAKPVLRPGKLEALKGVLYAY